MDKWEMLKNGIKDRIAWYKEEEYRSEKESTRMITLEMLIEEMETLEEIEKENENS